eukprot:COSAG01_NODE_6406_length_3675_cov_458.417015_5_plen_82_part_00
MHRSLLPSAIARHRIVSLAVRWLRARARAAALACRVGKLFDEAGVITPPYPFTVNPWRRRHQDAQRRPPLESCVGSHQCVE